jgi:hypothetical protein
MPDIIAGTYLPKGVKALVCKCGVVCYRWWKWSDKTGRQEPTLFDCETTGNKRPTSRIAGFGAAHVCKTKEKSA